MSQMQAQARQSLSIHERMAALMRSRVAVDLLAITLLVVGSAAFVAYLLARFPYDGLYGQDSYAYYYQSRALLQDINGAPSQAWQLYTSDGLYHWPIGYHLHLLLGLLITDSPVGGRAVTLFMTVGSTALLYLLVGQLWPGTSQRARVVAGLVAGAGLPLTATYTRMGLSIMADVPALFWGLLGLYCCLRVWPPPGSEAPDSKSRIAWAVAGGAALGIAVLIRYGAGLLIVPLFVYLVMRRQRRVLLRIQAPRPDARAQKELAIWWAALGFAIALLPQLAYLLTHQSAGAGYSDWLSSWTPANLFSTTTTSADGTSTFAQPMIIFYLLQPLYDSDVGFLSGFCLPALSLGLARLVWERKWPALALLLSWWIVPALFFAATTYQAHRFVLTYLPALLVLLGIGAAVAVEMAIVRFRSLTLRGGSVGFRLRAVRALSASVAVVVLVSLLLGAYREQGSVRSWMATHAAFKVEEQQVVSLARQAAGNYTQQAPPRVVAFGTTAALYHYTQWPIIDLYNYGDEEIGRFLDASGPRLLVLPVVSIATQWAGKPLEARWHWIQQTYALDSQGQAGIYTVYKVQGSRFKVQRIRATLNLEP